MTQLLGFSERNLPNFGLSQHLYPILGRFHQTRENTTNVNLHPSCL